MYNDEEDESKRALFYSDTGQVVLGMKSIGRDGDNLVMVGKLMGAWDSNIVIPPAAIVRTIAIMLNWSVVGYLLSLPYLLIKGRKKKED